MKIIMTNLFIILAVFFSLPTVHADEVLHDKCARDLLSKIDGEIQSQIDNIVIEAVKEFRAIVLLYKSVLNKGQIRPQLKQLSFYENDLKLEFTNDLEREDERHRMTVLIMETFNVKECKFILNNLALEKSLQDRFMEVVLARGDIIIKAKKNKITLWLIQNSIEIYKVPSLNMNPTIQKRDLIMVDNSYLNDNMKPLREDVIVYKFPLKPKTTFLGRVIGLPGEVIEVREKDVFIDGEKIDESYIVHSDPETLSSGSGPRDFFGPVTIPPESIFIMGDNRDRSHDSRFWGVANVAAIKGKVVCIYSSENSERNGRKIK